MFGHVVLISIVNCVWVVDGACLSGGNVVYQPSMFGHFRLDASEHVPDVACEALY